MNNKLKVRINLESKDYNINEVFTTISDAVSYLNSFNPKNNEATEYLNGLPESILKNNNGDLNEEPVERIINLSLRAPHSIPRLKLYKCPKCGNLSGFLLKANQKLEDAKCSHCGLYVFNRTRYGEATCPVCGLHTKFEGTSNLVEYRCKCGKIVPLEINQETGRFQTGEVD